MIMTLAQSVEIKVVAEGISNLHELQILQELGCKLAQGYLFSKPVNSQTATEFLSQLDYNWLDKIS